MGKGSNPVIGSWYGMKYLYMGICYGPVDQVDKILVGGRELWSGSVTETTNLDLDKPELFGGQHKEGGIQGKLSIRMGNADQAPHPTLVAAHGDLQPADRGRLMLLFSGLLSAMTPYIKAWSVRVSRWQEGWRTPVWEPTLCQIEKGMNPAHFIYRAMTDPVTGLGLDPAQTFDLDRMSAAAQTLYDEGLGLCLRWSRSDVVNGFVKTICEHAGGVMATDFSTGKQYLKLLRGDYDIDTLPLLDESNIIELSSFEPGVLAGSINQIIVKYKDIETNKDASVPANCPASMQAQGGRLISQSKDYPGAWNAALAGQLAERDLRAYTALPAKIKIIVRGDVDARKGDVLAFSWDKLKISRMPIRIGEIDRGTPTDTKVTLTCSQDVYSMPTSGWVTGQPGLWTPPDLTPTAAPDQALIEASYRDLAGTMRAADLAQLTDDSGYVGALGARPTSVAYGYKLTTRVGTTGDYKTVGSAPFAPCGKLQAAMPQEVGPTLVMLTDGIDLDQVEAGGEALVDGESCRVEAIDPDTGAVTLARGCVDSVPMGHDAGARVWFTDGFTGADPTEYLTNETIQAKLLTQTGQGTLDPAAAVPVSVTLDQRQARPYPPGNLMVDGEHYPQSATVDFPLAWSHRDRLLQADQLIDTAQTDIGPETGTTYTIRTYLDDALKHTYTEIADNTFTPGRLDADGELRVEVEAVRDGLRSRQRLVAAMNYQWLYTMDQTPFGTGDGSTDQFQLVNAAGQPITSDITIASIHQTDWQGRVELSDQPRTNWIGAADFDVGGGVWVMYWEGATVTGGQPAPDGTNHAYLIEPVTTGAHPTTSGISAVDPSASAGNPPFVGDAVSSVWVKEASPGAGGTVMVGVITTGADVVLGPDWQYVRRTNTYSASDDYNSARRELVINGASPFLAWAPQMTKASEEGIYIPTTGSPVTVTDYTPDGQGGITTGQVPVDGATLDWSGKGR